MGCIVMRLACYRIWLRQRCRTSKKDVNRLLAHSMFQSGRHQDQGQSRIIQANDRDRTVRPHQSCGTGLRLELDWTAPDPPEVRTQRRYGRLRSGFTGTARIMSVWSIRNGQCQAARH